MIVVKAQDAACAKLLELMSDMDELLVRDDGRAREVCGVSRRSIGIALRRVAGAYKIDRGVYQHTWTIDTDELQEAKQALIGDMPQELARNLRRRIDAVIRACKKGAK